MTFVVRSATPADAEQLTRLAEAVSELTPGTGFRAQSHRLDLLGTCARCAG